jgi:glutamine amidotransferase PdxT
MFDTIKSQIKGGMPVLATCAGLILLAQHIEGDDTVHLGTLPEHESMTDFDGLEHTGKID